MVEISKELKEDNFVQLIHLLPKRQRLTENNLQLIRNLRP